LDCILKQGGVTSFSYHEWVVDEEGGKLHRKAQATWCDATAFLRKHGNLPVTTQRHQACEVPRELNECWNIKSNKYLLMMSATPKYTSRDGERRTEKGGAS
jgi:hypothetical protein